MCQVTEMDIKSCELFGFMVKYTSNFQQRHERNSYGTLIKILQNTYYHQ